MYLICFFCLIVAIVIGVYTFCMMGQIKRLVSSLENFYEEVITPQFTLYETEYTEREKTFDKRIELLQRELSNHPSTTPAEILHPGIYNIDIENDDYMTVIDEEEVAE